MSQQPNFLDLIKNPERFSKKSSPSAQQNIPKQQQNYQQQYQQQQQRVIRQTEPQYIANPQIHQNQQKFSLQERVQKLSSIVQQDHKSSSNQGQYIQPQNIQQQPRQQQQPQQNQLFQKEKTSKFDPSKNLSRYTKKNRSLLVDKKKEDKINKSRANTLKDKQNVYYEDFDSNVQSINKWIKIILILILSLILLNIYLSTFDTLYYCHSSNDTPQSKLKDCQKCPNNAICQNGYFYCQGKIQISPPLGYKYNFFLQLVGYYRRDLETCVEKPIFGQEAKQFALQQIQDLESEYGFNLCNYNQKVPSKSLKEIKQYTEKNLKNADKNEQQIELYINKLDQFIRNPKNQKQYSYDLRTQGYDYIIHPKNYSLSFSCRIKLLVVENPFNSTLYSSIFVLIILGVWTVKKRVQQKKIAHEIYEYLMENLKKNVNKELCISQFDQFFYETYGSAYDKTVMKMVNDFRVKDEVQIYHDENEIIWIHL